MNEHTHKQTPRSNNFLQNSIGMSAKYFVVAVVCLFIWKSDSILPIYYTMAGVGNSILSKILKTIIKQPRPKHSPKGGNGMPSSHAQSISYFATVLEWKIYVYITNCALYVASKNEITAAYLAALSILGYTYYAW